MCCCGGSSNSNSWGKNLQNLADPGENKLHVSGWAFGGGRSQVAPADLSPSNGLQAFSASLKEGVAQAKFRMTSDLVNVDVGAQRSSDTAGGDL